MSNGKKRVLATATLVNILINFLLAATFCLVAINICKQSALIWIQIILNSHNSIYTTDIFEKVDFDKSQQTVTKL